MSASSTRDLVANASVRLNLDVDSVVAQFDRWRYSPANLREIESWATSDPTFFDCHCALLAEEAAEGFVP